MTTVSDLLGRPLQVVSPNQQGTTYSTVYTYNDALHEVRTYPGWNSSTDTTTGPIQITREYWPSANAPLGQQTICDETLTELPSVSIHLTGGIPDGTENVGTIYSLSRNILDGGERTIETDNYSNLTGVTYATPNAYLGGPFRIDGTTASAWASTYGTGGTYYDVAGYTAAWPSYLTTTPTMPSTSTWTTGAGSPLLYQPGSTSSYSNQYWSSTTSFTIDLPFNDAPTLHQVALYVVDFDKLGVNERIDATDVDTGTLLDSRTITNFSQGQYLVYNNLSGHVKFTVTNLSTVSGSKAVLSGIFFDAGSANNYNRTAFWFDAGGNLARTQDPNGTITRQVFNAYHEPTSTWIGTDDIPSSGWWSPTNNGGDSNMMDVADMIYDGQSAPAQPALSSGTISSGGSYFVQITYVVQDADGSTYETPPSVEELFSSSHNLVVTPPSVGPNIANVIGYNVYVGGSAPLPWFTDQLQNTSGSVSLSSSWTEPSGGIISSGITPPTTGAGDGLLTRVQQHALTSYDGTNDDRVTETYYDWRHRLTLSGITGAGDDRLSTMQLPVTAYSYDNLGELTETDQYSESGVNFFSVANLGQTDGVPNAPSSSLLFAKSTSAYDVLGNDYQDTQYNVDPSTHSVGSSLVTNRFYDNRQDQIEESDPGGLVTKDAYDGAGRVTKESLTDGGVIYGAAQDWANASSTTDDIVLEQWLYTYDADNNLIETIDRQRFDNDTAVGNLNGPSDNTGLASRDYYSASFFDVLDRLIGTVNVGTNAGSAWTPPSTLPGGSSSTELVSKTDYDLAGNVKDTIDPSGIKTGYFYDMLGQQRFVISNWDGTGSLASPPTPGNSTNQTIEDTYDGNGNVFSMTAIQPSGGTTPNQTTGYIYGSNGSWLFHNNDLLFEIEYPNKTTGAPSTSSADQEQLDYDGMGDQVEFKGEGTGTTLYYIRDVTGRMTSQQIWTQGTGVDGTVREMSYSFTGLGLPYQQTSYSTTNGTGILNQVEDVYNGYGQLTTEYQEHSGAVNTSTSAKVQYNYSQPTGANYSRLTSIVDPNGRQIDYLYGGTSAVNAITHSGMTATVTTAVPTNFTTGDTITVSGSSVSTYNGTFTITGITNSTQFTYTLLTTPGSNASGTDMTVTGTANGTGLSLDGAISRVSAIKDDSDGNILESYNYLGSDTIVQQNRPQPGVDLTYIQQNGDTLYSTAGGDRYRGLDEFGRVVDQFWTNPNSPTTSTTDRFQFGYDTDNNVLFRNNLVSSSNSELYAYDSNNRLTSFQRGTLNTGHNAIVGTPSVNETWSLDALGNWTGGTQARTFNAQNQITGISGTTSTPSYDNNGNMTLDQNGNIYTFDAWNRLVKVSTATTTEKFVYDADGRLIQTNYPCGGPTTDSYYSSDWQNVEDDQNAGGVVTKRTYVWGLASQDELIARDEKVGSSSTTRIYVQQDPLDSVTALLDSAGNVLQRFQYDVYGSATVLTAAWATSTDSYNWIWRWEAGRFDSISGLEKFRYRDYDPALGVWSERDPLRYFDGDNMYSVDRSSPTVKRDSSGLATTVDPNSFVVSLLNPDGTINSNFIQHYLNSPSWGYSGPSSLYGPGEHPPYLKVPGGYRPNVPLVSYPGTLSYGGRGPCPASLQRLMDLFNAMERDHEAKVLAELQKIYGTPLPGADQQDWDMRQRDKNDMTNSWELEKGYLVQSYGMLIQMLIMSGAPDAQQYVNQLQQKINNILCGVPG